MKTLENKIKEKEIKIKEKDKIINGNLQKQINTTSNDPSNSDYNIKRISELEDEINKLKSYFISPEDKLITIKFISTDQKVNFSTFAKIEDKLEEIVYNKYPEYTEYVIHYKKIILKIKIY